MKIEIDGILPAVGSMPITEWEIYVDGEKQIIRNFESRGFREFAIEVEPLVVIKKSLEEEKKMLNVDKYREEIFEEIKIAMKGSSPAPIVLAVSRVHNRHTGEKCDFFEPELEWLFSEYEPPLLKNGDGLKPGDWIMVRDGDGVSWRKRQFMCYFDNRFYCFKPHSQFKNEWDCVMWAQARLPEEGE